MKFERYQHVTQLDFDETQGIEVGLTHIFPKLDGTNGSVWMSDDGDIMAGSRNRTLSLDFDNAGFLAWILQQPCFVTFFSEFPKLRLYGEWLVPHTVKDYRDDAWNKFYVFDVTDENDYLTYDQYKPMLEKHGIDFVPRYFTAENATIDKLKERVDQCNFLMKDGCIGEGIVIKNYDYKNRFGRIVWAKVVRQEFKDNHRGKGLKSPHISQETRVEIQVLDLLTEAFVMKEFNKIKLEKDGWNNKYIPMLFGKVWYEFINDNVWDILKKYKNPTIDFKNLHAMIINKTKQFLKEIF